MTVLNERLGHKLANAMEQAKIAASVSHADAPIPLDWIEPALASCVTPEGLEQHLDGPLGRSWLVPSSACSGQVLQAADLHAIYLTGGSSALRPLRDALRKAFPDTAQVEGRLVREAWPWGRAVAP